MRNLRRKTTLDCQRAVQFLVSFKSMRLASNCKFELMVSQQKMTGLDRFEQSKEIVTCGRIQVWHRFYHMVVKIYPKKRKVLRLLREIHVDHFCFFCC